MPLSSSCPEYKRDLNFLLLPLNWISQLPPEVCASGPVLADSQTNGPLHEVDGIQHQRKEQFGLEKCQDLFVLNQIPACIEIFFFLIAAVLLYCTLKKIKASAREQGCATIFSSAQIKMLWGCLWCGRSLLTSQSWWLWGVTASAANNYLHMGFSASMWSSLHLFLSQIQQRKLRFTIVIMWQGVVARRRERRVPAEFF